MARPKRKSPPKLLTEVELELMSILWQLGEGTVREVLEELPPERDLAYTSVSTIIRILEQKRLLTSRKKGRAHIYRPTMKKAEYERRSLDHLVEKVFDGAPSALVVRLLDIDNLSPEEIDAIRRAIEERLG